MPKLEEAIIELEKEVKNYKVFVVKHTKQIQNIANSNVQRVLTPKEIKKMYAMKDDLYFALRSKGYEGKVTELESAIETRKQNDIKIMDNFQKAVKEYLESPHIKEDMRKIDKKKARQLLETLQNYRTAAEYYNDLRLEAGLSTFPIDVFELYFCKLKEEIRQKATDRSDNIKMDKENLANKIKESSETGLLHDIGDFVKEHYKGVIGTAAGLSAAGLAVYLGVKHAPEIAKIGKPVLLSLPYLGLGGVTCWRAANEGPQVFAITFAFTLGFTIGGPYLIPMIPFLPDMSPATCAYLGGLAGGFGATILDMFDFFQ